MKYSTLRKDRALLTMDLPFDCPFGPLGLNGIEFLSNLQPFQSTVPVGCLVIDANLVLPFDFSTVEDIVARKIRFECDISVHYILAAGWPTSIPFPPAEHATSFPHQLIHNKRL